MRVLVGISRFLNRWVEIALFVFGFTMAAIVAVQVFFRYGLNHSLFWSEELSRYLLVWLTFLGASVAYHRKAHPGIDVFVTMIPLRLKKPVAVFVHLISLVLFSVMVIYGFQFSYFVRLQITPALYLPKWILFGIVPLSGIIFMIHGLSFLLQDLKENHRDS